MIGQNAAFSGHPPLAARLLASRPARSESFNLRRTWCAILGLNQRQTATRPAHQAATPTPGEADSDDTERGGDRGDRRRYREQTNGYGPQLCAERLATERLTRVGFVSRHGTVLPDRRRPRAAGVWTR